MQWHNHDRSISHLHKRRGWTGGHFQLPRSSHPSSDLGAWFLLSCVSAHVLGVITSRVQAQRPIRNMEQVTCSLKGDVSKSVHYSLNSFIGDLSSWPYPAAREAWKCSPALCPEKKKEENQGRWLESASKMIDLNTFTPYSVPLSQCLQDKCK